MTEFEIVLAALTTVFFVAFVAVLRKLIETLERINKLTATNDKLKGVVRQQKAECDEMRKKLAQPTEQSMTAMNRVIFLQKETIDELRNQVAQQKKLLNQKWASAKRSVQLG